MPHTQQQLDEAIDHFDTAMLITESRGGLVRARPIHIAQHRARAELWFLGRASDAKNDEILHDCRAAVTMQGSGRYVSLSGRARLSTDREKILKAWGPSQLLWFPEGIDDPELILIEFCPERGELWNRRGLNRLEYIWRAGKALLTGRPADEAAAIGHTKVDLHRTWS